MGITHLSGLEVAGVPTMGIAGGPLATGNWFFVDAVNGSDGNPGTADSPMASVYWAYQNMVSGHNDVCVIVGSGAAAGSQRLSYANALAANAAATSGSLIWAKNACHLIGMGPPVFNSRARLAPPATYTAATFLNSQAVATTPIVSVTAAGCIFANFSVYGGFTTGDAGMLTWVDSGRENYYEGVSFLGMNDAASAAGANARSLVISGASGEHTFVNCNIGDNTTLRNTNSNASLQFVGRSPRNTFIDCTFRAWTSASTSLHFLAGSASIDRSVVFKRCTFLNAIDSATGVAMAVAATVNAGAGGSVLLQECASVGSTVYATTGPIYVMGSVPTGNTSGLAVAAT